jgi:hypothetical protein
MIKLLLFYSEFHFWVSLGDLFSKAWNLDSLLEVFQVIEALDPVVGEIFWKLFAFNI